MPKGRLTLWRLQVLVAGFAFIFTLLYWRLGSALNALSSRQDVRAGGEERRGGFTHHTGLEVAGQELQDMPALLPARRHYAQHPLDKPAGPLAGRPTGSWLSR